MPGDKDTKIYGEGMLNAENAQVDTLVGPTMGEHQTQGAGYITRGNAQSSKKNLLQWFQMLKTSGKTFRDIYPNQVTEDTTGRLLADLLSQDYVWGIMEDLAPMEWYIFDGKGEMELRRFHATMLGTIGGILAFMTRQMEDYSRQCFNDVAVDEGHVDRLIKAGMDNTGEQGRAACWALRSIYMSMQQGRPSGFGARCDIRKYMDEAFVHHLGLGSKVENLFCNQRSSLWKMAMDSYWTHLIKGLPKLIRTITAMDPSLSSDNQGNSITSYKSCVAKVKVLQFLAMHQLGGEPLAAVPFLSRNVYTQMVKKLESIDDALKEFSRWWEPLIDMVPVIGRSWTPGSATAALVRAIQCHRDIRPESRAIAVERTMYVVWNHYASFINMNFQLKNIFVLPRVAKRNNLLSIFGVSSDGHDTKELRKALAVTTNTTAESGEKAVGKENADLAHEDDDGSEWVDDDLFSIEDASTMDERRTDKEALGKYDALITLNREWKQLATLLRNSEPDTRSQIPRIDVTRSSPSFNQPWSKVSSVSRKRPRVGMRGVGLIERTGWEWWLDLDSHSFTRLMGSLAAAAIAESSTIISYRHELILCQPRGGAATVRIRAQEAVASTLLHIDRNTVQLVKPTLEEFIAWCRLGNTDKDGDYYPTGCLTWADGIYPPTPTGGLEEHMIDIEVPRLQREQALGSQEREAQRIVDAVQNMSVAWHEPTRHAHPQHHPRLDNDVKAALQTLADAINVNAYRQRTAGANTSFDPTIAMNSEERLHITFRDGPGSQYDQFRMDSHIQHQLDMPTVDESLDYLEALGNRYVEWMQTQIASEQEQEETKGDPKEQAPTSGNYSFNELDMDSALFNDLPVNSGGEFLSDTPSTSPERNADLLVDSDENSQSNTPSISSEMYSDLPVNSAGEFISSTPSLICWENHSEHPSNSAGGDIGNAPSISPYLAARSLRSLSGSDEGIAENGSVRSYMHVELGPIDSASKHVSISANRARAILESKKRHRALTVSSTGSKDGRGNEQKRPISSKRSSKRTKCNIDSVTTDARTSVLTPSKHRR